MPPNSPLSLSISLRRLHPRFLSSTSQLLPPPKSNSAPTSNPAPNPTANPNLAMKSSPRPPRRPDTLAALDVLESKRRVRGSPTLPLEAVVLAPKVQTLIISAIKAQKLTSKEIRLSSRIHDRIIAPETAVAKKKKKKKGLGNPRVELPPAYTPREAVAHAVVRAPGTMTTNMYVLSEVSRRLGKDFRPGKVLDFGAGVGVASMAAGRVFDGVESVICVDEAKEMRDLAKVLLPADEDVEGIDVRVLQSLSEADEEEHGFDMVMASYSLNEVARSAMAIPRMTGEGGAEEVVLKRGERVQLAEKRLRKAIRDLWAKTKEGGVLVVVEDGTAAGFEVVLFVRESILGMERVKAKKEIEAQKEGAQAQNDDVEDTEDLSWEGRMGARIVAPCMHSKRCPLLGNVTRHRICRFTQRFNRPPFLRHNRPLPRGFQDEFFTYIAIQKVKPQEGEEVVVRADSEDTAGENAEQVDDSTKFEYRARDKEQPWGRLIRAPVRKGKHVTMDACTLEGKLERRVVSKRKAGQGQFALARRSRWGDIWPIMPKAKPQDVNF